MSFFDKSFCSMRVPSLPSEPAIPRKNDGLGARPDTELVEEIRDVVADGLLADRQALADLSIAEAIRDERQDLPLAWRERVKCRIGAALQRQPHEVEHRRLEARPGRLVLQEDVVAGVELYELGSWDPRGEL